MKLAKTAWKSYFKNNEKIPGNLLKKTLKNHGNIMEFCKPEKMGTLVALTDKNGLYSNSFGLSIGLNGCRLH